jgi:hypothetical protein
MRHILSWGPLNFNSTSSPTATTSDQNSIPSQRIPHRACRETPDRHRPFRRADGHWS